MKRERIAELRRKMHHRGFLRGAAIAIADSYKAGCDARICDTIRAQIATLDEFGTEAMRGNLAELKQIHDTAEELRTA